MLSRLNGNDLIEKPWENVSVIIYKVCKHVVEHENLLDVVILLEINEMWNDVVERYIKQTFEIL